MSTITPASVRAEDLLTMPDGDRYELVNGQLVERKMGAEASYVAGEVYSLLQAYCKANHLGWVFPEGASYQCFAQDPDKVRRADTSFIRLGRFPKEVLPKGHLKLVPDLVVEVVSPNDLVYEVDIKIEEYLEASVPLVWVVNPATQTVRVFRAGGPETTLRAADELTGDDILPGFRCSVRELFQSPV